MTFENIKTENSDHILIITINRPNKLNALNIETIKEIGDAVNEGISDNDTYGMIITGEGEKAFAAGADIAEFSDFDKKNGRDMAQNGHTVFNTIEKSTKPIIAAVNGFALGGGCELAMACHLRIASKNAKFGQPEVNLGLIPGYGGTQRLVQLIGKSKALEYLLTGDMISAEKALNLNLINDITDLENLLEYCKSLLSKILAKSPEAISKIISTVNAYYTDEQHGFETEINAFANCFGTPDFKEGVDAFLGKRKPRFRNEN